MTKAAVMAGLLVPAVSMAEVPAHGVPSGCDGAAMSAKYWQVWSSAEQSKIDADIERNRKADATIAIDAPDGAEVAVEQLDHEFRFRTCAGCSGNWFCGLAVGE